MNYIDIILIIPLLWAVYRGFTKGFIIAVAGLVALILGIYGAIYFSGFSASILFKYFDNNPETIRIIAFAVTFIVIVILVHLVAKLIDALLKAIALGFVNRLAGLIFNVIKMAFILSIFISILNFFDPASKIISEKAKEESFLYTPFSRIAPAVFPYFKNLRFPAPEEKPEPVSKQT